jgi:hypothetical protein
MNLSSLLKRLTQRLRRLEPPRPEETPHLIASTNQRTVVICNACRVSPPLVSPDTLAAGDTVVTLGVGGDCPTCGAKGSLVLAYEGKATVRPLSDLAGLEGAGGAWHTGSTTPFQTDVGMGLSGGGGGSVLPSMTSLDREHRGGGTVVSIGSERKFPRPAKDFRDHLLELDELGAGGPESSDVVDRAWDFDHTWDCPECERLRARVKELEAELASALEPKKTEWRDG